MVLVTPNIPNNTIFAMSQTTELYYLLCSFQNIEFEEIDSVFLITPYSPMLLYTSQFWIIAEKDKSIAERNSVIESLKAEIEQLKAGK